MIPIEEAQKDKSLMDEFIDENMGLVRMAIKKLGLPYHDEYIQEGAIGLIKAVKWFNPSYGFAFSTYAIPQIEGHIKRFRRDYECENITGAKVSRTVKDIFYRTLYLENETDEDICKELKIDLDMLNHVRNAMQPCSHLEVELFNDHDGSELFLKDRLQSEDADIQETVCEKLFLESLYSHLNERQSKVLSLHLADLPQTQIAKGAGISQAQVSRILTQIITIGKEISDGRRKQLSAKITKDQLTTECITLGMSEEAFAIIAGKYGVTTGTVKHHFYSWGIKDQLKPKKTEIPDETTIPVVNEANEPIQQAVPKPIKQQLDDKKPILKPKAWDGKECSYAFHDGKLVISIDVMSLSVEDYKAMLLELQAIINMKEAV